MEKAGISLIFLACFLLMVIQIRGIIQGRFPAFGFKNINVKLDSLDIKVSISAGVLFLLGLVLFCASM